MWEDLTIVDSAVIWDGDGVLNFIRVEKLNSLLSALDCRYDMTSCFKFLPHDFPVKSDFDLKL